MRIRLSGTCHYWTESLIKDTSFETGVEYLGGLPFTRDPVGYEFYLACGK